MTVLERLEQMRTAATPTPWTYLGVPREYPHHEQGPTLSSADRQLAKAAVNALPALLRIARAAEAYRVEADWYRCCLEGVIDRTPVRGLDEARHGFDAATDELRSALSDLEANT